MSSSFLVFNEYLILYWINQMRNQMSAHTCQSNVRNQLGLWFQLTLWLIKMIGWMTVFSLLSATLDMQISIIFKARYLKVFFMLINWATLNFEVCETIKHFKWLSLLFFWIFYFIKNLQFCYFAFAYCKGARCFLTICQGSKYFSIYSCRNKDDWKVIFGFYAVITLSKRERIFFGSIP